MADLTMDDLKIIFSKLNGWDGNGRSKVTMGYRVVIPNDQNPNQNLHITSKFALGMALCPQNPDWYFVDILSHSYQDSEFKLLWAHLQNAKRRMDQHPEEDIFFHFNFVENASVSMLNDRSIFSVDMVNPIYFNLCYETPNAPGATLIRMLFPANCIQFSFTSPENADILEERKQVLRAQDDLLATMDNSYFESEE